MLKEGGICGDALGSLRKEKRKMTVKGNMVKSLLARGSTVSSLVAEVGNVMLKEQSNT